MKSGRWVWVAMAALCAVLATMVVVRSRSALPDVASAAAPAPGRARAALVPSGAPPVPDFTVVGFDGRPVKSADFRGKVTILNFWATRRGPCRIEIPEFVALQKEYPDRLQIVGLSMDDAAADDVKRFAEAQKVNYRVGMATPEIAARFGGVPALPTSFLIDAEGHVVARHIGLYDAGTWAREIRALAGLPYDGQVDFSDAGPPSSARSPTRPISGRGLGEPDARAAARRARADEVGALHVRLRPHGRAVPPERPDLRHQPAARAEDRGRGEA